LMDLSVHTLVIFLLAIHNFNVPYKLVQATHIPHLIIKEFGG
jgi:hypothetical protein